MNASDFQQQILQGTVFQEAEFVEILPWPIRRSMSPPSPRGTGRKRDRKPQLRGNSKLARARAIRLRTRIRSGELAVLRARENTRVSNPVRSMMAIGTAVEPRGA